MPAASRQQGQHQPNGGAREMLQQTQLAQPHPRQSYAEAAHTNTRRAKTPTKVIANRENRGLQVDIYNLLWRVATAQFCRRVRIGIETLPKQA